MSIRQMLMIIYFYLNPSLSLNKPILFVVYFGMQYLLNPDLDTIKSDWKGNPFDGKEFQYVDKPFYPNWGVVSKMLISPNPQLRQKWQDKWRPKVFTDDSFLDSSKDYVVWLGHASFLIQINGIRLLTDPVFYNLALLKRFVPMPFSLEIFKTLDYILLSHDHRDHCDQKSLQRVLQLSLIHI